jgi:hypothetical protein
VQVGGGINFNKERGNVKKNNFAPQIPIIFPLMPRATFLTEQPVVLVVTNTSSREKKESEVEATADKIHFLPQYTQTAHKIYFDSIQYLKNTIEMATLIIIKKAILDMNDRTGSSLPALKKWFETNEKVCRRIRVVSFGCKSLLRPFSVSVNLFFRKKKTRINCVN